LWGHAISPLGAFGATGIANFLLIRFDVGPIPMTIHPLALRIQIIVALVMLLLASLIPIITGLRISVRESLAYQ
jgi:ABC-type antimicrobial peptide transport system permease subunit